MTEQERKTIVAQLWATRASVDAALTALGAFDDEDVEGTPGASRPCSHPTDERIDETTMGGPEWWRCRVCGFSTLPTESPSNASPDTSLTTES